MPRSGPWIKIKPCYRSWRGSVRAGSPERGGSHAWELGSRSSQPAYTRGADQGYYGPHFGARLEEALQERPTSSMEAEEFQQDIFEVVQEDLPIGIQEFLPHMVPEGLFEAVQKDLTETPFIDAMRADAARWESEFRWRVSCPATGHVWEDCPQKLKLFCNLCGCGRSTVMTVVAPYRPLDSITSARSAVSATKSSRAGP